MSGRANQIVPGAELMPGLHVIGLTKGMKGAYKKGGYSKAYLFDDVNHGRLTLVDALYDSDAQQVIDYLLAIGRSATELTDIILTHSHRSHIGGAAALKRISNARVWCHASEAAIVEGTEKPVKIPLWPLWPHVVYPIRVMSNLERAPHEACEVDETPEEGDRVGSLRLLHVPGHTPGNLAVWWPEARVVAVADIILTWPRLAAGWPGFNADESLYRRSLRRLLDLDPEVVCVAHGEPICNAPQALTALARYPRW